MGNKFNAGLTPEQEEVLTRLKYDSTKDQLIAKSSLSVPLNSLYVGEQHKLSSGGDDIFLSNITRNIDYFFGVGGIKDQFVPANQDKTGIIPLYERVYSELAEVVVDYVEKTPFEYAPYLFESFVVDQDRTSFGIEVRTGDALSVGDVIRFSITRGDTMIYMQDAIIELAVAVGEKYIFKYAQPIEYTGGDVLDIKMDYSSDGKETWTQLNVSVGVNAGEIHDLVLRRNYIDVPVHHKGRVVDSFSTGDDLVIRPYENILIGTLDNDIELTIHESTESFTIRDLDENIGTYSVLVTLNYYDSLELNKKNDSVVLNKPDDVWYYYNFRNRKGEVI